MELNNIFIINRNLLTTTKAQVEWFQSYGLNPTIIDNDSDYPPLLDFYSQSPCKVIRLGRNVGGAGALYDPDVVMTWLNGPLLVTDSDLDLSSIKSDWQSALAEALVKYPDRKIGFSLSLDNLPDHEISTQVKAWESQFSTKEIEAGYYDAPIDTTFYLAYQAEFDYLGIRLKDYTAIHTPWHWDLFNLTNEQKYYLKTINSASTWGNKIKAFLKKHNIPL